MMSWRGGEEGVWCGESEWGGKIKQVGMGEGCRQLNNIYHHCRDQPDFLISGILAKYGCVYCHVESNEQTSFHLKTALPAQILPCGFCPENPELILRRKLCLKSDPQVH